MRATREGYGVGIQEVARKNENVVALAADLAGSTQAIKIANVDPKRFFQVGIAELNMVDLAAGMAACGKIPFASTFAMFGTGRAWEAFRNSVAYPKLNVKLACTHSGLSVGEDGASHQSLEDIALTRVIPNVTVVVPCDFESARIATHKAVEIDGPVYLRLGRPKLPDIYQPEAKYEIGKGNVLREGVDVAIIACGPLVSMALDAADMLGKEGIAATVVDMHTIKPLDTDLLDQLAETCGCFVTAEEHNVIGGLGSAVAEHLAQSTPCPVRMVGTKDTFGESGKPDDLWKKYNLTPEAVRDAAREVTEAK